MARKSHRSGDVARTVGDNSRLFDKLVDLRTTGRLWTRDEIIARYQIARSTFYTIPYFRATAIYVTPNTRRWADADVAAFEALQRGAR